VLFGTYNLLDLFGSDTAADRQHYEMIVEVIRGLDADVLAVQEVLAPDERLAFGRLRQLADDTGMSCVVPAAEGASERVALAAGSHGYHVGLMWRAGIEPVPGSFRGSPAREFWHSLASVTLDVGGTLVRHAAYHASPFCRIQRADQNERLVAALTRPLAPHPPSTSPAPFLPPSRPLLGPPIVLPAVVGADWNTECADRVPDGDSWPLYEPGDPYAGVEWFGDMVYQCEWDYDERGLRRHWADRRPGDVLFAGGLYDAAAVLRAPWHATAGHHPDDVYGAHGVSRRIDAVRVTRPVRGALRGYHVTDTALTRAASDHLPVSIEYAPAEFQ
jgi:endonuclease/exonuclease/phosphatase family metal-dependent hydrolase